MRFPAHPRQIDRLYEQKRKHLSLSLWKPKPAKHDTIVPKTLGIREETGYFQTVEYDNSVLSEIRNEPRCGRGDVLDFF